MKVLIAAAAAAVLIALPAVAQTTPATPATPAPASNCPALAAPPTLPDGATANREAMAAGNTTYQAWATAYQAGYQCRHTEAQQAMAAAQALVAESNRSADTLNQTTAAWQADVAEFTARGGSVATTNGNRRQRGGVMGHNDNQ
jgi:hypothetical protein